MKPQLDPNTMAGFEQVEELAHARTKYFTQVYSIPQESMTTKDVTKAIDSALAEFTETHDRLQAEYHRQIASQQPADQAQRGE